MKLKILKLTLLVCASSAVLGCASKGFNRGALKEQVAVTRPAFDDKEIKDAFNKKSNLPKPFKLGVYFKSPAAVSGQPTWRWTEQDKAIFESLATDLKIQGVVSEIFPINSSIVIDESLRSVRLAAAKHQADALLIIEGTSQIDRYINKWGWSYALLVPTLFVKGSEADTIFVNSAALWDVKNEYLYLTSEAESVTKESYVAAFGKSDKELVDKAKTESLVKLKDDLSKMVKGVKL